MATVSVYQLKVRQVKWLHYLLNKQLEVGSITLTRPQVTLERFPEASQSSPNKKSQPQKSVLESLPEKLSPIATSLAIKELTIENLSFRDWQHAQKRGN